MKKFALLFVLMSVLSVSAIADDGQIPIGGKSCQNGQSCLVLTENPKSADNPIKQTIFDFWKYIFG